MQVTIGDRYTAISSADIVGAAGMVVVWKNAAMLEKVSVKILVWVVLLNRDAFCEDFSFIWAAYFAEATIATIPTTRMQIPGMVSPDWIIEIPHIIIPIERISKIGVNIKPIRCFF